MNNSSSLRPRSALQRERGVAIVIVLALIVLVTGLVVAFFSRSLQDMQISKSSSDLAKVDLFVQGAAEVIIGDLRQEIVVSSTATTVTTGTGTTTLYTGTSAAAAVPQLVGSSGTNGLENLLKISKAGLPAYASGMTRAFALSSTSASLNSRSISPQRWNKHLLLRKKNTSSTNAEPVAVFTAPDWILVDRSGKNPTSWDNSMGWSGTGANSVVGRYAYAIYNVGGLLDANVAGYPSNLSGTQAASKQAVAFANLTQLGLNQNEVDALVGWRNYASAQPSGSFPSFTFASASGSNYYNYVTSNKAGFMTTANTALYNDQSDRFFSGRQQLITFFNDLGAANGRQAQLQNALQYFTTFSRSLNQPSYRPDPNRPKVMGAAYDTLSPTTYSGGNDAYEQDDLCNPAFREIRVTANFTRFDGSPAVVGELLIKKRFALERLCWITCQGPSAYANTTVRNAYLNLGVPAALLDQGTAENIQKYFGLSWTPGPGTGGIGGFWTYEHDFPTYVATLGSLRDKREPDFFELLKAAIAVGSVAKGGQANGLNLTTSSNVLHRFILAQGTLVDSQIIQIGANIIDQASPDNFPTRIVFTNLSGPQNFYGTEDLPYLYNQFNLNILVRKPSNFNGATITGNTQYIPPFTVSGTNTNFLPPEDPGLSVALLVPTVWNPHKQSSVSLATDLTPTNLRICTSMLSVSSTSTLTSSPGSFYLEMYPLLSHTSVGTFSSPVKFKAPWASGTYDASSNRINMPVSGAMGNTSMTFKNVASLYREPTPLVRTGVPASSSLALDSNNVMTTSGSTGWGSGVPESFTGVRYIGFYSGTFPVQWKVANSGSCTVYTANCLNCADGGFGQTVSLEYETGGTWVPYMQVMVPHKNRTRQIVTCDYILSSANGSITRSGLETFGGNSTSSGGANTQAVVMWDPRSRRWTPTNNISAGTFHDWATSNPLTDPNSRATIQTYRKDAAKGSPSGSYYIGGCSQDMYIYYLLLLNTPTLGMFTDDNGYIIDADRVIRRPMGGNVPATSPGIASTTVGLPLATVSGISANQNNRPILLHRPFRSVAELGYVFSDTPWRNIDFSKPESGYAALLDVFCINESKSADALVAGKVDLNTRQAPVLKAVLAGACRDELNLAGATGMLSGSDAGLVADALVKRTTDTTTLGKGPLANISELVGRFQSGAATLTSQPYYDGFSKDLTNLYAGSSTTAQANNYVSRFQESAMRSLSDTGQAGTWNLLIDLVAQVGRYPQNAANASQFLVEGEKRYWLHLAIDRQTGEVIDRQIEPVNE